MIKFILMLLPVIVSGSVMAEWVNAGTGVDGTSVYTNPSTIRKKGNKVKLWAMFDYRTPETANTYPPSTYQSAKLQYEFDCEEERYTTKAFYEYSENMGGGKIVFSSELAVTMNAGGTHWVSVMPDTLDEVLLNYACNRKYRDNINAQNAREKAKIEAAAKQEKNGHTKDGFNHLIELYSADSPKVALPASNVTPNTRSLADEWDAIEVKQGNNKQ